MKTVLLFAFCFAVLRLSAQYNADYSIPVSKTSVLDYKFPWVGGLNNPQFSSIDLNNDGIQDLFIFDKTGNKIYTFLNHGTPNTVDYTYAPQFESHFPELTDWALIRDYNCDGIGDIFSYTGIPATGIKVYRGFYDANNEIQFSLASQMLTFPFNTIPVNLYCSRVDLPAINDIDGDGDLDIITFKILNGYIEQYTNLSEESGYGCDSLIYKLEDNCWGDVYATTYQRADLLNQPCPFFTGDTANSRLHNGDTEVAFDNDGDGDCELIRGNIFFSSLLYCENDGTISDSHVDAEDTLFPSYDVPADVFVFPAAFLLDLNNDGLNDMMVSPNAIGGVENFNVAWYYKNQGNAITANFSYQTDSFFVNDMLDVGELAYPIFFDADGDGKKDLLIANRGYFQASGSYLGQIAYYRNVGTLTAPVFQLVTKNYANVASLNQLSICPAFGDLDGDGDDDMLLGNEDGTLLFFRNTATAGNPANFVFEQANYAGIDVGTLSAPQLVDVDHDGKIDLLIGEQSGNINYYQNTGTSAAPVFTLQNAAFGGVDVRQPGFLTGESVPWLGDLDGSGQYTLLVGCERGFIFKYSNIDGNLGGTFTLDDSTYSDIFEGVRSTVSAVDVDGDGKVELLVGNYRGGVTYYTQSPVGEPEVLTEQKSWYIYPNPATSNISIVNENNFETGDEVLLINALGNVCRKMIVANQTKSLNLPVKDLAGGIYFLQIITNNTRGIGKVAIVR